MIVNVKGIGKVSFPDKMTQAEVREVLRQFEPKKDYTTERLLESIEKMLKSQKPQIVEKQVVKTVEVPKIVEKVKIEHVDRVVEIQAEPLTAWEFQIERDENDMISSVTAVPYG